MGNNNSRTGRRTGLLSFVPRSNRHSNAPSTDVSTISKKSKNEDKNKKTEQATSAKAKSKVPSNGPSNGTTPRSDISTTKSAPSSPTSKVSVTPESNINRANFILQKSGNLNDQYDMDVRPLGQGTYGSVSKAKHKATGHQRAIKVISKSQLHNVERFRQEIAIMKALDHPNIVKLYETFEDSKNIYLVMELCMGGELFDRIIEQGHFTEKDAGTIMKQILSAVHYLHTMHVMHRDLKPENFLFLSKAKDSALKIIDFGLSCKIKKSGPATTKAGTPYYVAPQVLQGSYDEKCDEWSAGVILYILLCGYPPFYGETDSEILSKVKNGRYSFSGAEWRRVSDEAKDLIRKLLKMHSSDRISAEHGLNHAFIINIVHTSTHLSLPNTLLCNLKSFRAHNKLKKAALTVIAQYLDEKDVENLRAVFQKLDTDNSGTLTVNEMTEGLKKNGHREIPHNFHTILKDIDSDNSGVIDYTEFLAAAIDRKYHMKEDLCEIAFRVLDQDSNGTISKDELRSILGLHEIKESCGGEINQDDIDQIFNEVDLNLDGQIDFYEFMVMMKNKYPAAAKPLAGKRNGELASKH